MGHVHLPFSFKLRLKSRTFRAIPVKRNFFSKKCPCKIKVWPRLWQLPSLTFLPYRWRFSNFCLCNLHNECFRYWALFLPTLGCQERLAVKSFRGGLVSIWFQYISECKTLPVKRKKTYLDWASCGLDVHLKTAFARTPSPLDRNRKSPHQWTHGPWFLSAWVHSIPVLIALQLSLSRCFL